MEQSPKRTRVTQEDIERMREHRRLLAESQAQVKQPESRPSLPQLPGIRKASAFAVRTHTREY